MRLWLLLMLWCAAAAVGQRPTPNKRHDVYIAGFFPFGGRVSGSIPEGRVGRGVMPAVKLAVDHINENPTLLRNYRLHVWWNDTQVRNREGSCGGLYRFMPNIPVRPTPFRFRTTHKRVQSAHPQIPKC